MSIIFPLFGTGTPQGIATDGYFLDGTDLKRIKSESFEIDTIFSNVNGFFVDRKENVYVSTSDGNIRKYRKIRGNLNLVWQISGGFVGGSKSGSDDDYLIKSYPFISDFQNVAIDSQFNFYFRDTTDSNKLKKYSLNGDLVTSTNSDIGAFAINKDGIFSFSGNTVTKRNLSGNSLSSFTVTGIPVALSPNLVFTEQFNSETFNFVDPNSPADRYGGNFNTIRGYNLADSNQAWSLDRIVNLIDYFEDTSTVHRSADISFSYQYIALKNDTLLVKVSLVNARIGTHAGGGRVGVSDESGIQFYGYIRVLSNGSSFIPSQIRITGNISSYSIAKAVFGGLNLEKYLVTNSSSQVFSLNEYLYTQGANSDRSRLNF